MATAAIQVQNIPEESLNKTEFISLKRSHSEELASTNTSGDNTCNNVDEDLSEDSSKDYDCKRSKLGNDREHRLAANREHAKASRKRKKVMIEDLQKSLVTLKNVNSSLRDTQSQLQQELHLGRSRSGLPPIGHDYVSVPTSQWENMTLRLAWYENQARKLSTNQTTNLTSVSAEAVAAAATLAAQSQFSFLVRSNPVTAGPQQQALKQDVTV